MLISDFFFQGTWVVRGIRWRCPLLWTQMSLRQNLSKTVFSVNLSSANALRNKRHISSRSTSRSTSIFTSRSTPGSDDSQELERDLHKEKEAHGALIQEGGVLSHSAHLGFHILDEPGEYKDISYWENGRYTFQEQLHKWREFYQWQQRAQQYYIK